MAQLPNAELEYQRLADARQFIYTHNQARSIEECQRNAQKLRGQAYLLKERFQGYAEQQTPYRKKLKYANSFLTWVTKLFRTFGLAFGFGLILSMLFALERSFWELLALAGLVVLCRAVAEFVGYIFSEHLLRHIFDRPWRIWRDRMTKIDQALLPVKVAHDELEDQASLLDNRATELANRAARTSSHCRSSHHVIRACVPYSDLSLPF